ncbi:PTS-dependent dihydroxyacetone kinase%2C dihydroxyacetone-binding subunit dhaK [uncultured Roseburia sp.]|uniref:Dihydroxyacetone kinase subunit DhaK n=1 Tax=Brotonthovivens ammoniilytica TaxID=2981725 RepID=A0ABT2TNF0_9FIRM|nr:dihydroxyacetone kinase subunit DhaK [Brotonthovivens ammoniilytica]MCU6763316.1 dihydroxyacetone kinase subunit DhaK [Brotonthovivens ammoniilytica]SCJ13080.1 PTS-dependent dihydroxyacetone kinase%2C dihydroxyacetone-binding subunit dhaK [uncultured Roseburia sp.]
MKKIMNLPENMVMEMCYGMAQAHPELAFHPKYKFFNRSEADKEKVTLISGGGSGHEPAHAGLVGLGMLDGAVCGDIFASPSQIQIYKAIKETAGKKGTLLIIKNYSGDMMNFKNAAQMAAEDGIDVDYIKVDDDIAVEDSLYTVGRRGVAGTVLVHKIAGAAAEEGKSLAQVKAIAGKAVRNIKSIGAAYTPCTVPAKGTPTFELAEDEMEFGVGIHGEPGRKREKILTADQLAVRMLKPLLEELQTGENAGWETAMLVNGFGATPLQELYLLADSAMKYLSERDIKVSRIFVGNYMTSIDMAGASITLLKMDEELKKYLTAPADTPAFKMTGEEKDVNFRFEIQKEKEAESVNYQLETDPEYGKIRNHKISLENIIFIVDKMSQVIIEKEIPFCELDSHAGDGDFGMSVAKGFRELKKEWKDLIRDSSDSIGTFLSACSLIIMEYCGGASGPIWGSAFRAAGRCVKDKTELSVTEFADMMQAAVAGIQKTGERSFGRGAVVGDKTLIDALVPCADTWSSSSDTDEITKVFMNAANAAKEGAAETAQIVARMGRAGTVGERSIGYPDAGAYALGVIFTEIAEALTND